MILLITFLRDKKNLSAESGCREDQEEDIFYIFVKLKSNSI